MFKKTVIAAICASALFALSSCSDPEGEANAEFVALSNSLATADKETDPIKRHELLSAASKTLEDIKTRFATTNVAVRIASDEKVGPFKPSQLAAEIETLAKHPAFCAKNPTKDCITKWIADHGSKLSDADKSQSAISRVTVALRLGDVATARGIIDWFKVNKPSQQPVSDTLGHYFADLTRKSDFWTPSSTDQAFVSALGDQPIETFLRDGFKQGVEKRLSYLRDIDTLTQLYALALAAPSPEKPTKQVVSAAYGAWPKNATPDQAKEIVTTLPKPLVMAMIKYADDRWHLLDAAAQRTLIEAVPDGDFNDIPWSVRSSIPLDELKAMLAKRTDKQDKERILYVILYKYGVDMPASEFISLAKGLTVSSQRGLTIDGIIHRMVKNRGEASALADHLAKINQSNSPDDREAYQAAVDMWSKLARASTPSEAKAIIEHYTHVVVYGDDMRLGVVARYRPDILPPDDFVNYLMTWGDTLNTRWNNLAKSGVRDAFGAVYGVNAAKDVKPQTVKRALELYMTKPYGDPDTILWAKGLRPYLTENGYGDLVAELDQVMVRSKASNAGRNWAITIVQDSVKAKDIKPAVDILLTLEDWELTDVLAIEVIPNVKDPMNLAILDKVVSANPKAALSGFKKIRSSGASRDDLEPAFAMLPRISSVLRASSPDDAMAADVEYVNWLWLTRDKVGLSKVLFAPEAVHPVAWYIAADAYLGL